MSKTEPDIIIIRGAPAVGKSETAKELAKHFPKGVRMEIDTLRSMVISVDWTNQNEHKTLLNISTNLVNEFLLAGFKPVIVVDTFSGDKLNDYLNKLLEFVENSKIYIFGLYAENEVLKERLEKRPENKFKDYSITTMINEDTLRYKHTCEIQIDTSNLMVKDTAKMMLFANINALI